MATVLPVGEKEKRPSKRHQVSAACSECRRRKIKCDAGRPVCGRCRAHELPCSYDVAPGVTRALALKRKHASLEEENQRMYELFGYIRTRSTPEVAEIVNRIRTSDDVMSVLQLVQQGDLLLQQQTQSQLANPRTSRVDSDALRQSILKVPARPWTTVAGDGIVSDLISSFMDTEQPYMAPFVHPQAFVTDMNRADPANAKYCSPMLVNAICAFTSFYALAIDVAAENKLSDLFFDEARKHLDRESGKASLATSQALPLLYTYCCEMYKRMECGERMPLHPPGEDAIAHRKTISRHAWGLFYLETYVAFAYLQPPLINLPTIPLDFADSEPLVQTDWPVPIGSDQILAAQCRAASIFARIASYRPSEGDQTGSATDVQVRVVFHDELRKWARSLPPKHCYPEDKLPQYHFLSAYYDFVAISIFRPLLGMSANLPGLHSSPETLCLSHFIDMLAKLEPWERVRARDFDRGCIMTMYFYYLSGFTLLPLVEQYEASRAPFTTSCMYTQRFAQFFPAAAAILSGLRALARQMNIQLPQECLPYFDEKRSLPGSGDDIPISWAVPQHADLLELLSDKEASTAQPNIELGQIIAKWNRMSLGV